MKDDMAYERDSAGTSVRPRRANKGHVNLWRALVYTDTTNSRQELPMAATGPLRF
jgi:hypothetical protein